jgi:hypothetical protein
MTVHVSRINSCSILIFTEDDDNQELMDLIQSFRLEASKLLGMLDVSNSTVARLKVLSTEILGIPVHRYIVLLLAVVSCAFQMNDYSPVRVITRVV